MRVISPLVAVMLVAACSNPDTTPPNIPGTGTPAANQVFMQNSAFTPVSRNVAAGTAVQWVNQDGVAHNVTSSSVPAGAAVIVSGNVAASGTFSATLNTAGTYAYFCSLHGTATTGMRATVVVN